MAHVDVYLTKWINAHLEIKITKSVTSSKYSIAKWEISAKHNRNKHRKSSPTSGLITIAIFTDQMVSDGFSFIGKCSMRVIKFRSF